MIATNVHITLAGILVFDAYIKGGRAFALNFKHEVDRQEAFRCNERNFSAKYIRSPPFTFPRSSAHNETHLATLIVLTTFAYCR